MQTGGTTWAAITGGSPLLRAVRWLSCIPRRWRVRSPKQLQLCESLALGERRFVAVVRFEQRRFLIGATVNSVVMLAQLSGAGSSSDEETEEQCG
jgi:flagellar biogenesis protein FliO